MNKKNRSIYLLWPKLLHRVTINRTAAIYSERIHKRAYTYCYTREGRTIKGIGPRISDKYTVNKINWPNFSNKSDFTRYIITARTSFHMTDRCIKTNRILISRYCARNYSNKYFLRIRPYPHRMVRHHKMASGSNADRISAGMRKSFGSPHAWVALVKKDQIIFELMVARKYKMKIFRQLYKVISSKLGRRLSYATMAYKN